MNKQNFEAADRFPLSTQALSFMQEMILACSKLALIGGERYILSGCELQGTSVNPGWIVLDGEILPFEGGVRAATITVVETPVPVTANGLTYEEARVVRKAIFATGNTENYYLWSEFRRLTTNQRLEAAKATRVYVNQEIAKVQAATVPIGAIVMWSGTISSIPAGWCLCDGQVAGGKRTPDLRGRFIVSYNSTRGSGYNAIGAGKKNSDQYMMTLSKENMPKHNHGMDEVSREISSGEYGIIRKSKSGEKKTTPRADDGDSGTEPDVTVSPRSVALKMEGANESFDLRPPYYVLAFIMKVN